MAKKKEDCPTCKGNGWVWETDTKGIQHKIDCFTCGGDGKIEVQE